MSERRGSTRQWLRNWRASRAGFLDRALMTARNLRARLGPPPRGCCDHDGEPGC